MNFRISQQKKKKKEITQSVVKDKLIEIAEDNKWKLISGPGFEQNQ